MAMVEPPSFFQLQAPRLTTTLRSFGDHSDSVFDIDKAYLERKLALQEQRKQRKLSVSIGATDLARRLITSWETAPLEIRQVYEEFLSTVAALLGGELTSEELHESATIVYDCLGALEKGTTREQGQRISELFGYVSEAHVSKVAELCHKLRNWNARPIESVSREQDLPEFGDDIQFNLSSRSLEPPHRETEWKEEETGTSGRVTVNLRWIKQICGPSGDEVAFAVCRALDSRAPGEEVAGQLFDLMGDASFEHIQLLLQHRKELVQAVHKALANLKSEKPAQSLQARVPSYGTQVSVQTSSDRQIDKLRRKEEKRQGKRSLHNGMEESELDTVGSFSALVEASERSDTGLEGLIGKGDGFIGFSAASIPPGAERKVFKGYEEVHVPATLTAAMKPGESLVEISQLDDFAQAAFEGYKTLNRIQSRIFHTAFNSNENILVCAPTGAGKTNIAMIAVLHEVKRHFKYGILMKNEFKIVYVAPMKALAAEVTAAFGRRLAPLNVNVKELTGDMQLTKRELEQTQMIVTTPEKWDVITRKTSDMALASLVKLLIIDEVHLLNDDRGPVIEALVARTLRQVESSQSMIRIVGLSATLPNYKEVAQFLRVNLESGLFYFDASYRPVPLSQQYIGITETNFALRNMLMNEICYSKLFEAVRRGQQAMVFVHSRKDTVKTARILVELARKNGETDCFLNLEHPQYGLIKKEVINCRNREVAELFESGFGVHHAGMLRAHRNLTERLFSEGLLKVLVCTATLAWGVNLPAHMVIIKGTQLYDPKAGGWRELGMLDVMQIFGRAGRPQFDSSGEGIIITAHDKLLHYLRLITHQLPIESQFINSLKDNLNAEVVLGTVTNVREASNWLSYTYLFKRMTSNPLAYGLSWDEAMSDPGLVAKRNALITEAARALNQAKMLRFDEKSGNLYTTDLGRVASHFYLRYTSVETYNEMLKRHMSDSELLNLVSHSSEFENIVVREEEQDELAKLLRNACPIDVPGGPENKHGKINILIQVCISQGYLDSFSLVADSAYINASLGRIMRALFEICLRRGWCSMAAMLLEYCKAVDHRIWPHQHPLRQFQGVISLEILRKLEDRRATMDRLYDMDEKEIGALLSNPHGGNLVYQCVQQFPSLYLSATVSPITRSVLQVALTITPSFVWKDRFHGASLRWWIWVEDSENEHIYHSEEWTLTKKMMPEGSHTISFTIPIFEPLPSQYYIRAISDNWLQASSFLTLSFQHLILPEVHPPHTELLNLRPLPVTALKNQRYEDRYGFSHFNPIQTQCFYTLYHTDHNVLLGAPTGSGKTISAELAMLHLFNTQPDMKVIYIAPLKALVRERVEDWKQGLSPALGKKLVELTGDFTPDMLALLEADIIVSTPEKWDGISRNWQTRSYVQKVGLMIIDEIHLLGADRGPILEVIVSRMRYISSQTERPVRFVGLSTALANARDLADWLGIAEVGLYNFKPSVRPVPLEVHIQGYPGKYYCPRMNSMNKPTYAAIRTHSPVKPVLVFVSSRRQTRLTALDLMQFAAADEQPRQFLAMSEDEADGLVRQVSDNNLKHTLQFGIGLHHAGLNDTDRALVVKLFRVNKIQVLVCTSTLAWGINLPAHLVIVKGTEFYDGKTKRYVDYPITDVLQMMGRAGRPQFDQHGKAVILVHEPKKSFYKKFLYEPFPVESSLAQHFHNHLNAEIASGTIRTKQDALHYLTWTYLYRRLVMNPSYYGLEDTDADATNHYLSSLVNSTLLDLEDAGCANLVEDAVEAQMPGHIASKYYLDYRTVALFTRNVQGDTSLEMLLNLLSASAEYDELPVRHNEENLNELLAKEVRLPVDDRQLESPHTKTNLLLQAHFSRLELPITDYITDTKSVLDQCIRIIQAMIEISANGGWLRTTVRAMQLLQMTMQGLWWDEPPLLMIPHMDEELISVLGLTTMEHFLSLSSMQLGNLLKGRVADASVADITQAWSRFPRIELKWKMRDQIFDETAQNISFNLEVRVSSRRKRPSNRAFLHRYPKAKEEGWWLVLGSSSSWELHALKRVSLRDGNTTTTSLVVTGVQANEDLKLFLVSDCYLGLDQTHVISSLGNGTASTEDPQ